MTLLGETNENKFPFMTLWEVEVIPLHDTVGDEINKQSPIMEAFIAALEVACNECLVNVCLLLQPIPVRCLVVQDVCEGDAKFGGSFRGTLKSGGSSGT